MATQQFRYMMITGIVLLTIFLYVIYSTNDMQVPGRIHPSSAASLIGVSGGSGTDAESSSSSSNSRSSSNTSIQYPINSNNSNSSNSTKHNLTNYNKIVIEDQHKKQINVPGENLLLFIFLLTFH